MATKQRGSAAAKDQEMAATEATGTKLSKGTSRNSRPVQDASWVEFESRLGVGSGLPFPIMAEEEVVDVTGFFAPKAMDSSSAVNVADSGLTAGERSP